MSVALAHLNLRPVPALVVHAHCLRVLKCARPPSAAVTIGTVSCALTYLVRPRRELNLDNKFPLSFAGVLFPPSLK